MVRGLSEYLQAPLQAVLDFCDSIDSLAKRRSQLLLDYDHHKRKHETATVRKMKVQYMGNPSRLVFLYFLGRVDEVSRRTAVSTFCMFKTIVWLIKDQINPCWIVGPRSILLGNGVLLELC